MVNIQHHNRPRSPCRRDCRKAGRARRLARKCCAGDNQSRNRAEIHRRHIRLGQREIGGIIAVKHRLRAFGNRLDHGKRGAGLGPCKADMARRHAVTTQFGQAIPPHRILRHPRQQSHLCALSRQGHRDIARRAANRRRKAACRLDLRARWVGVKIHPHPPQDHKAVQSHARRKPLQAHKAAGD